MPDQPPVDQLDRLKNTAVAAARRAGAILRDHAGTALRVDAARRNDLKLEADRLCEAAIVAAIRADFPDHAILAEEGGARQGRAPYRWIVDPLDGTVNYFHGLPYYCTSVACCRLPAAGGDCGPELIGEPLVGAVYAPVQDELFVAAAGQGAALNGRRLQASRVRDLRESIIATGFGSLPENIRRMRAVCELLVDRVRKVRVMGAAAYDMANVAAGRLSGYYERGIRTWDLAAGLLLMQEAGAAVTASAIGADAWEVLASAPGIHPQLRAAVEGQA